MFKVGRSIFQVGDLRLTRWDDGTLAENGSYTVESDIYQLGRAFERLVAINKIEVGADGKDLMDRLLAKSIAADGILGHQFLLQTRDQDLSQPL